MTIVDLGGPYIFDDCANFNDSDGIVFPIRLELKTADGAFAGEAQMRLDIRAEMSAITGGSVTIADRDGTYSYPTPDGPMLGDSRVHVVMFFSPKCAVEGRFHLTGGGTEIGHFGRLRSGGGSAPGGATGQRPHARPAPSTGSRKIV